MRLGGYGAIQQAGRDVPHLTPDELKPQKVKGVSLAEKVFGAVETVEGVAQRLNAKIMGSVQPMAEKAAVSAQNERRAKELAENHPAYERGNIQMELKITY